jgi:DNA-directed RNA polymerase specialized sigma24 family protein
MRVESWKSMRASDALLVSKVRRGDAAAFAVLVDRYLCPAYAMPFTLVGSAAADACQAAFAEGLDRLDQCPQPERFATWLLEIVKDVAREYRAQRIAC